LAARRGVALCVLPAIARSNFEAVRQWAHQSGDAYCLGIHPLYVGQASDDDLQALDQALQQHQHDPHLVGVGEIGLDLFVPELQRSPLLERQTHFFLAQLALARKYGLPVVLHSRRSVDQVLKGLRAVAGPAGRWQGIAHAFNGSLQQAQVMMALGCKLGFGGAMTFDRALQLRRLASQLPLETIVLETDSPDMPPHWLYSTAEQRASGQVQALNSPAQLPRIAAELALLRGISDESLAQASTANALQALPKLTGLLAQQVG
jgi:TatD DNase family protein